MPDINKMVGKVFIKVEVDNSKDELSFHEENGNIWVFYHSQCCCESVVIEDINGNLNDLENTPLTLAEESSGELVDDRYESATWTFYKFASIKGYIDVRWLGTSNGYYSESVDLRIDNRSEELKKVINKLDLE